MTIHLIRHGHTEANAQRRYCGRTNLPLSPEGVEQLRVLKTQGIYPRASAFYTSGMLRAQQTLTFLYDNVKATSIAELAEYDFGSFEMRRYEELQHNPDYAVWIADESGEVACPCGESKRQYDRRVMRGFSYLLSDMEEKRHSSSTAVVHGGTVVHIMSRLFPDEKDFYAWQPLPGLGYTLFRNREGLFTYQPIKGEDTP